MEVVLERCTDGRTLQLLEKLLLVNYRLLMLLMGVPVSIFRPSSSTYEFIQALKSSVGQFGNEYGYSFRFIRGLSASRCSGRR